MPRLVLHLGLLFGLALCSAGAANACGDKLLALGRGVRFQVLSDSHPASILLYAPAGSQASDVMNDPQLQTALRKAGHNVQVIDDRNLLEKAMKSGRYDLVLAPVGDASTLEDQVQAAATGPVIVPVMYQGTKAETDTVQRRYHRLLKTPNKSGKYLSVIDRAMELKAKRDRNAIRASK